ncbi:hypothetical protein B0H17DRAFT_1150372 [Mycena rosella]|uniref:Uncharacterized protein n=1 Tax=Mycena rosella TaxID=1033263 RepID=A0AAD7BTA2_MYCRO|nr:hypothetical protein B0H17DRAFT_1150372 [Mycena rosella]
MAVLQGHAMASSGRRRKNGKAPAAGCHCHSTAMPAAGNAEGNGRSGSRCQETRYSSAFHYILDIPITAPQCYTRYSGVVKYLSQMLQKMHPQPGWRGSNIVDNSEHQSNAPALGGVATRLSLFVTVLSLFPSFTATQNTLRRGLIDGADPAIQYGPEAAAYQVASGDRHFSTPVNSNWYTFERVGARHSPPFPSSMLTLDRDWDILPATGQLLFPTTCISAQKEFLVSISMGFRIVAAFYHAALTAQAPHSSAHRSTGKLPASMQTAKRLTDQNYGNEGKQISKSPHASRESNTHLF